VRDNAVRRLRLVGVVEGVSFLLLLGVAMPLKYMAGMPLAVRLVGWAHGLLFILYAAALAAAFSQRRWSAGRALWLFVASLLPGGPFLTHGWLRREEERGA
jgi:integral membrane protein